jgi:ABC-type transport system involved in cytochrome c biogenesis permease component
MRILPVVGRELRAIARRPSAYWVRSVAAAATFIVLGYVALMSASGAPTALQGRSLFDLLSLSAFVYCALAGVRGTSDALSQEKREGTLGLLFLTDLKGYDVVLGKLVSVSMTSLYAMLSMAPPLALAFMLGGTSVLQFVLMIVFLLNTLFFSLAVGIFISTFSQQERPAMGGTLAIIFVTLAMPYAIATAHSFGILEIWEVLDPGFLLTSPAFAFWTIKQPSALRIYLDEVFLSLAFTHLAGWLCLVVASASIAQRAHTDSPQGKLAGWFLRLRQDWAYGKAERRRAIRGALLDRNAFAWLAGRDRLKQRYAWVFLILLGGLWSVARWKAPEVTEEWPITLFSLWFLHLFFKVWVGSEVAARFIDDRRSNALELLLTTPLKEREFASGERRALFRQFGAPIALIVVLNLIAGWSAGDSSSYILRTPQPMHFFVAGLVHLAFDLYAIVWVTIWRSLHLRGTNRTITQTIFLVVLLPVAGWFLIWQGSWLAWAAARRGGPTAAEILWTWTILCVIYDLALAFLARHAFFRDFREVATKAFDKPTPFNLKFWRARHRTKTTALPAPRPNSRLQRLRKIAIAFAIFLLCAHVAVSIRRNRLQSAIDTRLAAIRVSGLPLEVSSLAAWRPAPNASESASVILRQASKEFTAASLHPVQLFDLQAHWHSREKLPPDIKRNAAQCFQSNTNVFRFLEQLSSRIPGGAAYDDRYRFPLASDELARILQLKARVEMEDDPVAATKTIIILLYYARALQGESFGAFTGMRKALQCANELLERASVQGNFPAEAWREWGKILADFDPVSTFRANLIVERAHGLATFSWPVDMIYQRFGRQFGDFPIIFNIGWSLRRFFGQDKLEVIEFLDEMSACIAESDQPFWKIRKTPRHYVWHPPSLTSGTFIAPQMTPAFDWLFTVTTETVAYQRILIMATDVEIFKSTHGRLPVGVMELPALTRLDPFTGQPLNYLARPDGYSIYSVGEDMTDNGGVAYSGRQSGDIAFHSGPPPARKRLDKNPLTPR